MRTPRMGKAAGLTLVETTVAVSLMTAICLGTINVLISSAQIDKDAATTMVAEHELQSAMDYVKSVPYVSLTGSLPEDLLGISGTSTPTITPGSSPNGRSWTWVAGGGGPWALPNENITVQYYTNDTTHGEVTFHSLWGPTSVTYPNSATTAFPSQVEIRVTVTWSETWKNRNANNTATVTGNAGAVTNAAGLSTRTRTLTSAVIRTSAF